MTSRSEWPQWAQDHFPADHHRAAGWEPMVWHYPLHMHVLVVATTRIEGAWAAYCAPVPGRSHRDEVDEPLRHGDKVPEKVARAMFPHLEAIPYAQ